MAAKIAFYGKATCLLLVVMLSASANPASAQGFGAFKAPANANPPMAEDLPPPAAADADAAAADGASTASIPAMPAAATAAAAASSIVWVNRTSADPGQCNVTCAAAGLARFNESGWVTVAGPNITGLIGVMGSLCRRLLNGRCITGYVNTVYKSGVATDEWGCYIGDDATKAGLIAGSSYECACGRRCPESRIYPGWSADGCGIWKRTKACTCKSGCACGGFWPAKRAEYKGYYAFGVTAKGANAAKCTVMDLEGSATNYISSVATMHIGVCAGPN